jgi:hypothetical protein
MIKLCERIIKFRPAAAHALRRVGWPALVVALAIAWQYRAPLLGRVWYFEDIANYFVPLYTAAARSMRAGAFPVWDLGAWSGQPLVGDPQLGVFYPLNWLWLLIAPVTLYAWLTLVHAVIGATGMWAWARARGRSSGAAALAGLTLALGAFFVLEVRHAMFTATTAWLPWVAWAIERYGQTRRLEHFLWIALTGALALLGGGWSMLPYGGAVLGIVAVGVIVRSHNNFLRSHNNAAPQSELAPTPTSGGLAPASDNNVQAHNNNVRMHNKLALGLTLGAAGTLALALAAAALLPALAHARESPRALGVTYEIAASYAWPSWRYLATLMLPTLYGDDARGTYVGAPDQWELCGYGIGVVGTLLALGALAGRERRGERVALVLLGLAACDVARGAGGLLHPLLYHLPLFASLRCPARALYVWTVAAPILAADGFDTLMMQLHNNRLRQLIGATLLVAVAAELLFTWRSENPSTTPAQAMQRPQAISWLQTNGRPGRAVNDVHLPQSFHNMGLLHAVESAGGYHSLPIWRYLHLLWIANHGAPYPRARLGDDLTAQGLWRFASPIVDLLGVQWVVTAHDRPVTAPGFERTFVGSDGIDLFRNRDVFPRAFVVFRALAVAGEAEAARAVAAPTWRPDQVAVVEEPIAAVPAPSAADDAPPAVPMRQLLRLGPATLGIDVELPQPGVLVVAEPWYPGWRVRVDGAPAGLLRVDYALRGVALPPGPHRVEMTLSCPPLRLGGSVSLAALLVVALLAWWDMRRRRRAATARAST